MRITVFGSARMKPGDVDYQEAYRLGRLLGSARHTVLTGGYMGSMEAVSHGAADAGGHVIGVTCDAIESNRKAEANPWVLEERRFRTLRERVAALIDGCDAALALPGGVGTLMEICMMWNELVIAAIKPRPLILIGSAWQSTFTNFFDVMGNYIIEPDRKWLAFAPGIDEAFQKLQDFDSQFNAPHDI